MDVDFPSDERLHNHLWEFWRPASLGWAKKEHSPLAIWPGNEQFLIIQFIHSKTIHPSLKIISPIRHGLCPLFKSIWTLTWLSQWKHTVNTFRDDIYCISDGKPEKNIMALLTQKNPQVLPGLWREGHLWYPGAASAQPGALRWAHAAGPRRLSEFPGWCWWLVKPGLFLFHGEISKMNGLT